MIGLKRCRVCEMKHIKRCYGCGRIIWLWQETIKTEKVGYVHKSRSCILDAWYKLSEQKDEHRHPDPLLREAISALLGVKE